MAAISATSLQPWQRRMVTVAWITYAAYYFGRINISTAMPDLRTSLVLTKSEVGLISSGFFWAYAVGQLVNGQLGDRLSPRRFILIGMLASAGLNFAFGMSSSLPALIAVWALNGYFQATGWGPVLRTLANWLTPAQRAKVSGVFGSSFVVGNVVTWLLTGWLVSNLGWRAAFWMPAILLTAIALAWYAAARDTPEEEGHPPVNPPVAKTNAASLPALVGELLASLRRFWPLVSASVFLGFAFAALIVWLPTYYVDVGRLSVGLASVFSTLLPISGIAGTLLIGWALGRHWVGREAVGLALVLMALTLSFGAFPLLPKNLVIGTLALVVIGGIAYGATSVLLTTMSLALGGREKASSTAGLLDLSFNIGAGSSGAAVGAILDARGWNTVFIALAGAALIAALFLTTTFRRSGIQRVDA